MKRFPCTFVLALAALALTLSPTVFAQYTETILYGFGANFTDGALPTGPLAVDSKGNIYGTMSGGGNNGYGTIFEASPTSSGYNVTILYRFNLSDGATPSGGLIIDAAGNLYGTTESGGTNFQGTVFELSPSASGWTFQTLHLFAANGDALNPGSGLVMDAAGNLYGASLGGGTSGIGTVYELSPSSSGWTEQVLYSFTGGPDGKNPASTLVMDAAGNLYGTTQFGASMSGAVCSFEGGCGTVFRLSRGTTWTLSTLLTFQGIRGSNPAAGVIFDSAGNLYGTTERGGSCTSFAQGCGVAYKLTPTGRGPWKQTVLHVFKGFADGFGPVTSLTMDSAGNLFGSSLFGTALGFGSLWELSPSGSAWTLTPLVKFNNTNGAYPESPYLIDASGNLFTASSGGGQNTFGTLLELTPTATKKN